MFSQTFGSPYGHPKIKPFIDHVFSFFYLDQRIWFRNFQLNFNLINNRKNKSKPILIEIGPRMVLQPLKMLSGSFSGRIFWTNKDKIISQKNQEITKKWREKIYQTKNQDEKIKKELKTKKLNLIDNLNLN